MFALATPPGRGAVAVIRLSGAGAGDVLRALTRDALPTPRHAARARLYDAAGGLIDDALVLWFPRPASFTGDDVVELQLHGGLATTSATLRTLGAMPGLRPAEPGEFSRRAFANGKLDLTQAEAIADLVAAETEAQQRQALRQLDGELGRLYDGWRDSLLRSLAHLEAAIDFPDEDLPANVIDPLADSIAETARAITAHLADSRRGERLRTGFRIAILGAPNVGKSSLINWLAQRDAAIVAPTPGTTRDVVSVALDIGGFPVVVSDTAGLRPTADTIEAEGIRRAVREAEQADLKLIVLEAGAPISPDIAPMIDAESIIASNKIDLCRRSEANVSRRTYRVSAKTGEGIGELVQALTAEIEYRFGAQSTPSLTRERHRTALIECSTALDRAVAELARSELRPEIAAEDLRLAVRALGRITGRVDVEDILDIVFRDFCIGK